MLKLKLQYFGHLMWRVDSLEKTDAGRDWGQEEKGTTEDGMSVWHHWFNGREFEWTPGDGDGQGGMTCCDSWGHKESDMTGQLNWSELNMYHAKKSHLSCISLINRQNGCSVQFSHSLVSDSATTWITARQASLSITNSWSSLKLTSIESVMPPSHLILCHPLLLLPSIPSSIRVFSNQSTLCMRWPKYWSFSFNISPSNEHSGVISFRMDWLDFLGVTQRR